MRITWIRILTYVVFVNVRENYLRFYVQMYKFILAIYHSAVDFSSFTDMQSDGTYHLKILVPSVAAGAIIGKGGETIAQLQKDTTARVKMSKANDFYPGKFFLFLFSTSKYYLHEIIIIREDKLL